MGNQITPLHVCDLPSKTRECVYIEYHVLTETFIPIFNVYANLCVFWFMLETRLHFVCFGCLTREYNLSSLTSVLFTLYSHVPFLLAVHLHISHNTCSILFLSHDIAYVIPEIS